MVNSPMHSLGLNLQSWSSHLAVRLASPRFFCWLLCAHRNYEVNHFEVADCSDTWVAYFRG